jgi:hypothetical protein
MQGLCYEVLTACIEACTCVLHDGAIDTVLKGFVELAKTSNDKVDQVVYVCICLLFVVDCFDVLIGTLFTDTKEVVHCVIHYLKYFLADEFFLRREMSTSPSSIEVTQSNINNWLKSMLKRIIPEGSFEKKNDGLVNNNIIEAFIPYFIGKALLTLQYIELLRQLGLFLNFCLCFFH